MATDVDICNGALTKIGAEPINELTDDKKTARKCNLRFDVCRKAVLRLHPWKCTKARKQINASTTEPAFEWDNQFTLPSDLLRLWLITDINGIPVRHYELESGKILTNLETIYIKYGKDETNTAVYDDLLVEAISYYLAVDICYSLTQDNELRSQMQGFFDMILRQAKSVDSKEDHPKTVRGDRWIEERVLGKQRSRDPSTQYRNLR